MVLLALAEVIFREILINHLFWIWIALFSIVYFVTYITAYYFYYPRLLHQLYPVDILKQLRQAETKKYSQTSLDKTETNTSLLTDYGFNFNCHECAQRTSALLNALLTVYLSCTTFYQMNIASVDSVLEHIDSPNHMNSVTLLNINIAHNVCDIFRMLTNPFANKGNDFMAHHSIVVLSAACIKSIGHGGLGWMFFYGSSDIATIFLHISWYMRNCASHFNAAADNMRRIGTKSVLNKKHQNTLNQTLSITTLHKRVEQMETLTLLVFALTFLYVRVIHFTWTVPQIMYQVYLSNVFSTLYKFIGILNMSAIMILGYFWSSKIVSKIYHVVTNKSVKKVKHTLR